MKKISFILILILAMANIQAQNYFITFAGAGDTTDVSTIKVDNLTSGASVSLNGGDTLHLTGSLGIDAQNNGNGNLQIYPNPMKEKSILTFIVPESGVAVIGIADLSGRTVYQISLVLSPGTHSFCISGFSQGMYVVNVTGQNYFYTTKMISQSNSRSEESIEDVSTGKPSLLKSGKPLKSVKGTIEMIYAEGDLLLYKGTAGQYSTIVTDVPVVSKTITFNFVLCKDTSGTDYTTVTIGPQVWMAENLDVGVRINGSQVQTDNGIIEKYCYNDLDSNCNLYGGLYLWSEMMQYTANGGVQGICPTGWHLPTDGEWGVLSTFLGGDSIAGGKMKETGITNWASPNTGATNVSGFTALPGGMRGSAGPFYWITLSGNFWTSDQSDFLNAWVRGTNNDGKAVNRSDVGKDHGFSVRCIHD